MSSFGDRTLIRIAARAGDALLQRELKLAVAESCTGGAIGGVITSIPGSSCWFDRGFIVYSNRAKQEMLGVRADTLETHGAVSEEVVAEMAEGALSGGGAQISVAVSGIAGPDGGTGEKPVGTVCIAWQLAGTPTATETFLFPGDRDEVRRRTIATALERLIELLATPGQESVGG